MAKSAVKKAEAQLAEAQRLRAIAEASEAHLAEELAAVRQERDIIRAQFNAQEGQ
jgi:hypothetical protein